MRTLLIACGNTLRGDDGVADEALRLAQLPADCEMRAVHQLTPELAEEIARFRRVVFVDADARSVRLTIEPVGATVARSPLTHVSTPAEIVALATALFGFTGEALVCRIPARDFSPGPSRSPWAGVVARALVPAASALLPTLVVPESDE